MPSHSNAAEPPVDHLRLIVDDDEPGTPTQPKANEDIDALADLFLDESAIAPEREFRECATPPASGPGLPVEWVVASNTPRPQGAWIVAYARRRAETLEAPALLARTDGGAATVQRVAPPGGAVSHNRAGVIVVSLPVDSSLPKGFGSNDARITLLAGAGETGVVSAYSTIKRLAAGGVGSTRACAASLTIGVCFVGVARERALDAFRALRRASESFLGRRVEFAGSIEAPDHSPAPTLWRGAESTADELVEAAERADALAHERSSVPERVEPAPCVPAPVKAEHARTRETPVESSTARPFPARCPEAPSVHFELDAAGVLHLHAEDEGGSPADAAAALLSASAWAERHRETLAALARAQGASALAPGAPVCHLSTRDPRRVRALLDTSLRLDVVVEAARAGEPVRVALN